MTETLLDVRGLRTVFDTRAGTVCAVDGVDVRVERGECLGIVGESGSGKTLTVMALMRLLPKTATTQAASILFEGVDLQAMSDGTRSEEASAFAKVRGALSKLASATPRYQCQECGFSSQRLLWQCPSCRDWETQRPASRVQFDTVLQHSITK